MSKMREAYKKQMMEPFRGRELDFEAGYKAAIAAVKEGGPLTYAYRYPDGITMHPRNEDPMETIYLYRLPEDV